MHGMMVLMMLMTFLVGLAAMVFWVWTLIDCLTNKRLTEGQKVVWVVVIILLGWFGSLIYFFAGRAPRVYAPAPHYYVASQGYVQQPQVEQFSETNYGTYQDGYRAQSYPQPQFSASNPSLSHEDPSARQQAQYEEIQISYPEQSSTE